MKKHIIGSILLSAVLLLSSCGGKSEKTAYTAEDVTVLLDAGVFSREMEQVVLHDKFRNYLISCNFRLFNIFLSSVYNFI